MSTDVLIAIVAVVFVVAVILIGNARRAARERQAQESRDQTLFGDGGSHK